MTPDPSPTPEPSPTPDSGSDAAHASPLERLAAMPRARLAHLPTPLLGTPRLSEWLGRAPSYVKMDAETGFALGGNKVRKLEFELAPEQRMGVTHLITAGGPQSNHARVTAAFAARHGLGCILVTNGPEPRKPTGNALLHRLFGARIVTVADRAERAETMGRVAQEVEQDGGVAKIVPIGASTPLGSLGYAWAAGELTAQLDELRDGCAETRLFVSASSCGTVAGLLLGLALAGRDDVRVVAVSADASEDEIRSTTAELVAGGAGLLGATVDLPPFDVLDDQVGAGYGIPTPASTAALERFARTEGIVLDPTYTAKAAAGMIDWLVVHGLRARERAVFLHTGGAPGLLA